MIAFSSHRTVHCVAVVVCTRLYSKVAPNLNKLLKTMPKEVKHTAALQKQRQKLKEKNQKYIPGTVTLKVLGSGAKGAARSLYVFTDQSRYLFNCGEGTQRLAHEHRMKLSKLEHIFVTHCSWDNIGGLPGVALTIQDVGVPEISLHGPEGIDEIFKATRRFVILRDLAVKMADCSPDNHFEDNVMKVYYVPIQPAVENVKNKRTVYDESNGLNHEPCSLAKECSDDDVDYYAHERKNKIILSSEKEPRKQRRTDAVNSPSSGSAGNGATMCYICCLQPRPGTLCLEKCVEKGVPPGPLLGKLKSGEDVVLADGTVVLSSDVRLPDDPGPVFIVVECPSVDYLENLVKNAAISKRQMTATKDEDVACLVVHFTPQNVMNDPRYQLWMQKFSASTQHLILNEENSCMGSVAVHRVQYKLNLLHSELFPLLGDRSIRLEEQQFADADNLRKDELTNVDRKDDSTFNISDNICCYRGKTFDCIHLRPKRMWDRQGELTLTPKLFIDEARDVEGFSNALEELKQQVEDTKISFKNSDPRITFLGTGSCIPNKTRNTSGILLHISDSESILMDCGEGTFGQIVRLFGPEKADDILLGIRAIYVSHLHADHHIGLIGILKARRKAIDKQMGPNLRNPVFLLAPHQIMSWLSLYHWNFEPVTQEILLVANAQLNLKKHTVNEEVEKRVLEALNMVEVNTVPVKHCPNSFGVAFKHNSGWKLTYSGDTMPCSQLIDLGRDSDVLIHEATMEDELEDEARIKLHSTTSQAIEMGQNMNAKFILLTHFSQRYAKIPRINENFSSNVGIAFDNMQVFFHQLPLLPLLYSSLKLMFAEHYDEMEQKTFRRLLKQEEERRCQKV